MRKPLPRPQGPTAGILYLRSGSEHRFWPHDHIALLRDEWTGRIEATSADGETAHCIAVLPDFEHAPWVRVAPGVLVHPSHARQEDGVLVVPGEWRIPHRGRPPHPCPPREPEPMIPGTRIRRSEVIEVRWRGNRAGGITDDDVIPTDGTLREATLLHGDIIQVSRRYVNRWRVRALSYQQHTMTIGLDNGLQFHTKKSATSQGIREGLGLPALKADEETMTAWQHSLFSLELRDFPFDLFEASADTLQSLCHGNAECHIIAGAFVAQLALYGLPTASLDHMVTPERFTEAELRLYAHPITPTRGEATKLRRWVKATGGVHRRHPREAPRHLLRPSATLRADRARLRGRHRHAGGMQAAPEPPPRPSPATPATYATETVV